VGAGRRKNKSSAARESEKQKAKAAKDNLEAGFVPFAPLVGLDQSLGYTGPVTPSKSTLAGFVPNLAVAGQLSPLAMPAAYPAVDPCAAAVAAAALPTRLAAGMDPAQFGSLPRAPGSTRSAEAISEDGSRGGRRVRMRKNDRDGAHQADSSQHGSASTATDLAAGMARSRAEASMGPAESSGNGGLPSFQPFQNGAGASFVQPPLSSPMAPDWFSMAAAANQQQAVAAQQQLQYQAAAMQAQAMQAAAAGAWPQGNNPYLSGLCFPYNLYGAGSQWAAAYARCVSSTCCRMAMLSRVGGSAGGITCL
jgi:hypothetical protein